MKKSNAYILMYFILIALVACMVSCTTQKGYDYKTHHRKAHNAKPSKCYKKHNKW